MEICKECKKTVKKTYTCDHTKDSACCVECYTELHYYLTESMKSID